MDNFKNHIKFYSLLLILIGWAMLGGGGGVLPLADNIKLSCTVHSKDFISLNLI